MKDKHLQWPIYQHIQKEIDRVEVKENVYTIMFYLIRIIQILLTAAITFVTAVNDDPTSFKIMLLILAGLATLFTALETLFQVEAKKNTYKMILFELRSVRSEIVFHSLQRGNNEPDPFKIQDIFEQYKRATAFARSLIGADKTNPEATEEATTNADLPAK